MRYIRHLFFAVFSLLLAFIGDSSVRAAQNVRIASEIIHIDSPIPGLKLGLHHHFRKSSRPTSRQIVLFAEGSAVPTAGNAGFKINGVSWMDNLALSRQLTKLMKEPEIDATATAELFV
jgi:hypothetical protein